MTRYDVDRERDEIVVSQAGRETSLIRVKVTTPYLLADQYQAENRDRPVLYDAWTLVMDALEPEFLAGWKDDSLYLRSPLPWKDVRPVCGVGDCNSETVEGGATCRAHAGRWLA